MKKFNITCPKKYTKNGEEKTAWNRVGTLVKFDATSEKPEGYLMELNMYPDTKFAVFEDKPRESQPAPQDNGNQDSGYREPTVQTQDDEIPF